MPRKVADVFVVMKGEVPNSVFKNNNKRVRVSDKNYNFVCQTLTVTARKKLHPHIKLITSRSDEMTQPWARQSLVQLAPVWGRITDPQTVQTTTSDQSEY